MKTKLPKLSTMRNKADALLTPITQKLHPMCELRAPNCSGKTQVGHHHVHKSKSTRLRYELNNLIGLCHHCHVVLHNNESYWASKIVEKRGLPWFQALDSIKDEYVKADVHYYIANHARLKGILEAL